MKIVKIVGLLFFISGLATFFMSLGMNDYVLSEKTMLSLGEGERYIILNQSSKPMKGRIYTNNFQFISALNRAIQQANQILIDKYSIGSDKIAQIVSQAPEDTLVYDLDWILNISPDDNADVNTFQKNALSEQTAWMAERQFPSKDALKAELRNASEVINKSIFYKKGFDDYTVKTIKFTITKASGKGFLHENIPLLFLSSFGLWILGSLLYIIGYYGNKHTAIKNDHVFHNSLTSRGWLGIALGLLLITFYIILYFYPEYLTNWVALLDPISMALNGAPANQWFFYGFLYTCAVSIMGVGMILKYKHSRYHILRTFSIMFFQLCFAFIIPEILISLNKPGYDFKNIWPLDYDFFYSYNLDQLTGSGSLGWFMLFWGLALMIFAVPVITYFYGKRWYCSWVCGCGGLAETLGDPFRQLSNKSIGAWKVERWLIHGILLFAIFNTAGVLYTYFSGSYSIFGIQTESIKSSYGFLISSIFAGVVGTGFYPLMGNRVWCRFGCPLAAYLGIVQRFKSRFRITTNGGQCISCGNCSTYCEMGIDVRWYAQRGQNIIRASCVGCGVCAAVCPRGVLKLENGPENGRLNTPSLPGNESTRLAT